MNLTKATNGGNYLTNNTWFPLASPYNNKSWAQVLSELGQTNFIIRCDATLQTWTAVDEQMVVSVSSRLTDAIAV